ELLDRLTRPPASGGEPRWSRRALIRLLAAEQHWLKLPPLRFAACREQLAGLCQDELAGPAPGPPWLRVQALMVLAVAAPEDFVQLLPELLALAADEQVVVDQLLLDCYRLVRRPPHDTPVGLEQLRASLIRCGDYLEHSQAGWDHELIEDFVQVVRQLIFLIDQPGRSPEGSTKAAWARLREEWCRPVERHHFESRLLRVRDFVEVLRIVEPDRRLARAAQDDWEACARLVGERAVVYLPRLRPILAGDYVGGILGAQAQKRLVELSRTESAMLPAMAERLHSLAERPWLPGDLDWQAEWQDVLDRINWWHLVFFATHRPNTESPALLVDLLQSTPCSLKDVLESAAAALGGNLAVARGTDLDVQVFCPRALLYETVEHVIKNARRHRHAGAGTQRFEIALRRPGVDWVRISVRNTGSSPRPTPGNGIEELNRSLRPFDASLAAAPIRDGEWTFEAAITLQVWQEV
ncbi:MAG TPA: ATP-binding protein, partial [Actinospica sp.]|nr:ATP-binding protein [Actinospica sp.]